MIEDYKKRIEELNSKLDKIKEDNEQLKELVEKFKETGDKELRGRIGNLVAEIEAKKKDFDENAYLNYKGRRLWFGDAIFLDKYKGRLSDFSVEDDFITFLKISEGGEDVYEKGELAVLKNLKKVGLAVTGVKELKSENFPESIEEIYALGNKVVGCDLSGLKNLRKVDLSWTSIREILPEFLPESLEELWVDGDVDVSEVKGNPKFKKLKINIIYI